MLRVICPLGIVLSSCLPLDSDDPSRASMPRIIALSSDPAEAAPGASVLVTAALSGDTDLPFRWARCTSSRPLGENAAVAASCARGGEAPLSCDGASCSLKVPSDSCERFGPNVGETVRPAAPDQSGGYYLTIRLQHGDHDVALFRLRLRCALSAAPLAVVRDFNARYQANAAPTVEELEAIATAAGVELTARVTSAETYVVYPPGASALRTRRERVGARWFVSAGRMEHAEQVVHDDSVRNTWHIPATEPGTAWLVVSDDRGAASVRVFQRE